MNNVIAVSVKLNKLFNELLIPNNFLKGQNRNSFSSFVQKEKELGISFQLCANEFYMLTKHTQLAEMINIFSELEKIQDIKMESVKSQNYALAGQIREKENTLIGRLRVFQFLKNDYVFFEVTNNDELKIKSFQDANFNKLFLNLIFSEKIE